MFNQISLNLKPSVSAAAIITAVFAPAILLISTLSVTNSVAVMLYALVIAIWIYTLLKHALLCMPDSVIEFRIHGDRVVIVLADNSLHEVELHKATVWSPHFILLKAKSKRARLNQSELPRTFSFSVNRFNTCEKTLYRKSVLRQDNDIRRLRALILNNYFHLATEPGET